MRCFCKHCKTENYFAVYNAKSKSCVNCNQIINTKGTVISKNTKSPSKKFNLEDRLYINNQEFVVKGFVLYKGTELHDKNDHWKWEEYYLYNKASKTHLSLEYDYYEHEFYLYENLKVTKSLAPENLKLNSKVEFSHRYPGFRVQEIYAGKITHVWGEFPYELVVNETFYVYAGKPKEDNKEFLYTLEVDEYHVEAFRGIKLDKKTALNLITNPNSQNKLLVPLTGKLIAPAIRTYKNPTNSSASKNPGTISKNFAEGNIRHSPKNTKNKDDGFTTRQDKNKRLDEPWDSIYGVLLLTMFAVLALSALAMFFRESAGNSILTEKVNLCVPINVSGTINSSQLDTQCTNDTSSSVGQIVLSNPGKLYSIKIDNVSFSANTSQEVPIIVKMLDENFNTIKIQRGNIHPSQLHIEHIFRLSKEREVYFDISLDTSNITESSTINNINFSFQLTEGVLTPRYYILSMVLAAVSAFSLTVMYNIQLAIHKKK